MQFRIKPGVKDIPRLAAALILAVIPAIFSATRLNDALIWYILLFILSFLTIEGKEEGKSKWAWIALDVILPVFSSAFAIYFMQYINLVDHGKISTVDTSFLYVVMYSNETFRWTLEMLPIVGFYFLLRACMVPRRFAAAFTPLPFLIVGLIDYYTYMSRGHEVLASDIYSIKTALNVASTFQFPVKYPIIFLAMPYALFFIVCLRLKKEPKLLPWFGKVAICLVLSIVSGVVFYYRLDKFSQTNTPQGWMDKGSIYNGLLLNVALSAHALNQRAPEGYTESFVDDRVRELGIDPADPGSVSDDSANVIVILSESYMQLKDYLPMLGVYEDPTPYWNHMKENTIHGYVTSSVYGGNTPNTEFEVLTGITTAFLPTGSIPYTMFVDDDTYSIAWAMDNLGYRTTAMHCYLASGWQRTRVYPLLGFDKYMFIEDFHYDESDIVREYVSDQAAFENLVEVAAPVDGQKTFTFLITMQNHGGYQDAYENFPLKEYVKRSYAGDTFQVNTFINLAHKSDSALEWLIDTLSQKDEKYCVLIFGDHQPSLAGFTNNMAPGKNSSWCVPYIIWTNYDMDEELYNSQFDSMGYTSFNYLMLDVLKAANIEYPAYYQLLDRTRSEIPCISAIGFYSPSAQKFQYNEGATDPAEIDSLNSIHMLQYALMFDDDNGQFEQELHRVIDNIKNSRQE